MLVRPKYKCNWLSQPNNSQLII